MKTVTNNFKASQLDPSPTGIRHFYYKRRYWTGSAFAWESSWTELARTRVISTSPITWQLDTDQLNEFKVSNVTLNVDNSDNYWATANTIGFYAPDSGSPTYGYEKYWTKFQIRAGFLLPDGVTEEQVTLFTGLLVDDVMDSGSKRAQIQIQGLEITLLNTKAESIGTTVTNELTGTGNGATTAFTTANPGVGDVTAVRVNGVTQVLGVDYTLSQQNSTSLGAKITFTVAPTNTYPIRTDYYYWPQNKQFSDLVKLLLTAGGVPSGNQAVQATLFSNSVINTFSYQVAADFNTGTLSQLLDTEHTGMMEIDWQNAANYTVTSWSTTTSGWTIANTGSTDTLTSDGTYLIWSSGASGTPAGFYSVLSRALTAGIGTWEFKYTHTTANKGIINFGMSNAAYDPTGGSLGSGWGIVISGTNLQFIENGTGTSLATVTSDTSEHTVRITFTGDTVFVYFDGVLKITKSTTLPALQVSKITFEFQHANGISTANTIKVRDITTPATNGTGTWTSPIIDLTATPTVWGTMVIVDDQGGAAGSIVYATDVSADNFATHDGFTNISAGKVPQSTLRRYVKLRSTFSYPTATWPRSSGQGDPYVDGITFSATTTSTAVLLPNFAGQSAYEAIQAIGGYTNYEYGFNPDETFFFRARTAGASVMTLTQADYISQITGMDSGYSRVFGIVRATYGAYVREITDAGSTPTSPVARVSNARYDISPDSNIQIAATADIATGIATTLFAYFSKPRRRCRVVTKFLPQLDLSDIVTVTLFNNLPETLWYFGDTRVYYGRSDVYWWSSSNQFLSGVQFKVIGARFDIDKFNCELNLEEVVT